MTVPSRSLTDRELELARFLVRERDRNAGWAQRVRNLPSMAAQYEGHRDAYDMALAYVAGQHGFRSALGLEDHLADLDRLDGRAPEGELRALDGNR